MPVNFKSNTLAIKPKTKANNKKKPKAAELKTHNSKSIAKAIKKEKCESNTSAIDPKKQESYKSVAKVLPEKKVSATKIEKSNSESIAKAIKKEKCESNTLAIDPKKQEICKSVAKVLPEKKMVDMQLTPHLKQNIMNVAQAASGLMEMLEWYNKKHKNLVEIPELKINSKALGEIVITKTFKVSEKAVKKFLEFAEKHPQFKHQDLLGTAMIEFVERYHGF
jgi:hypothetical protein